MADQPESGKQPTSHPERRYMIRYPAKASTLIIREDDAMRIGIGGELKNISYGGLGILTSEPLEPGEQVKIELVNEIQRFRKLTRGTVRHATLLGPEVYLVGIELTLRLAPLEIMLLRMGIKSETNAAADKSNWI